MPVKILVNVQMLSQIRFSLNHTLILKTPSFRTSTFHTSYLIDLSRIIKACKVASPKSFSSVAIFQSFLSRLSSALSIAVFDVKIFNLGNCTCHLLVNFTSFIFTGSDAVHGYAGCVRALSTSVTLWFFIST